MNWKDYVTNGLGLPDKTKQFTFNPPAADPLFNKLKEHFSLIELPDELEELYCQTNGIGVAMEGIGALCELIWTVENVIETNKAYRCNPDFKDLYMSFDQLLFVADAGSGNLFGFVTPNGKFDRYDIFVWNHEDDSRTWVAPNLATFIEWWVKGNIAM